MWKGEVACAVCDEMRWLLDMYVIDHFVERNFEKFPESWQSLKELSDHEWSSVLDVSSPLNGVRVLPLSILCLRRLVRLCSFSSNGKEMLAEFLGLSQERMSEISSLRPFDDRGIKAKKKEQIGPIVTIVKCIRASSPFGCLVDVGAGLGHCSRILSGQMPDLEVKAVEGNDVLVQKANELDGKRQGEHQVERVACMVDEDSEELRQALPDGGVCLMGLHACGDLSPSILRAAVSTSAINSVLLFGCCYHKLNRGADKPFRQQWEGVPLEEEQVRCGFPMSARYSKVSLSYAARELACHSIDQMVSELRSESAPSHLHHCRRAVAEYVTVSCGGGRHLGLRGVGDGVPFDEYLERALVDHPDVWKRVREKLSSSAEFRDDVEQKLGNCVSEVFCVYAVRVLVAPLVETLILADRMQYLTENGISPFVFPAFSTSASPRNCALIGIKST